ncbi:MAG: hypothetical protein WDA12_02690 [Bacilli bacterium]
MRESVGSIFTYNIIIIFLFIIFAFIAATISYYKAFKVNTFVVSALEKYEGYNRLSVAEIDRSLKTIGYREEKGYTCPKREGVVALSRITGTNHRYCIYRNNEGNNYRSYGVVTYINIDLPIIGDFLSLPVYTKTVRLYNF